MDHDEPERFLLGVLLDLNDGRLTGGEGSRSYQAPVKLGGKGCLPRMKIDQLYSRYHGWRGGANYSK